MSQTTTIPNPEYNYEVALFGIRTLTNMHVGSGSENYGIIDNLIQRDPATNFPCINSSSLKGALREYCRNYLIDSNQGNIKHIFGSDKKDDENAEQSEMMSGKYRFLQADLLSIPLRGLDLPFYNATSPWLLKNLLNRIDLFRQVLTNDHWSSLTSLLGNHNGVHFGTGNAEVDLEGINLSAQTIPNGWSALNSKLGENIAVLKDTHFVELVSDFKLPVIARNTLNDGQSGNLWYEQVLPSETRLGFFVLYPKNDSKFNQFKESILKNPIQIGANGSIGYGFCKLFEIPLKIKTLSNETNN